METVYGRAWGGTRRAAGTRVIANSVDRWHHPHLRACNKSRFSGPTPDLGAGVCMLAKSSGNLYAHKRQWQDLLGLDPHLQPAKGVVLNSELNEKMLTCALLSPWDTLNWSKVCGDYLRVLFHCVHGVSTVPEMPVTGVPL